MLSVLSKYQPLWYLRDVIDYEIVMFLFSVFTILLFLLWELQYPGLRPKKLNFFILMIRLLLLLIYVMNLNIILNGIVVTNQPFYMLLIFKCLYFLVACHFRE